MTLPAGGPSRSPKLLEPAVGDLTLALLEQAAALHESENQRPADRESLRYCIAGYPSAVAVDRGRVVGFAYTERLAPDLLLLNNLLVASDYRGRRLGAGLMEYLERSAAPAWASIFLSHSKLWPHPPRRNPLEFYRKLGYREIWATANTTMMAKHLTP